MELDPVYCSGRLTAAALPKDLSPSSRWPSIISKLRDSGMLSINSEMLVMSVRQLDGQAAEPTAGVN